MTQNDVLLLQNVHVSEVEYTERFVNLGKGDLLSADASSVPAVLSAGTDGYILSRNTAEATGLQWVDPSALLLSVGADNQIPFVNDTDDDFEYSANFIYDTSSKSLYIDGGTTDGGDIILRYNAISMISLSALSTGGDIYGANGSTGGYDITLRSGNATASGDGGDVWIYGGDDYSGGGAGDIYINQSVSGTAKGGQVYLSPGTSGSGYTNVMMLDDNHKVYVNSAYFFAHYKGSNTGYTMIEDTTLATPASGYGRISPRDDGKIYYKNSAGIEYDLTEGASAGDVSVGSGDTTNYVAVWSNTAEISGYNGFQYNNTSGLLKITEEIATNTIHDITTLYVATTTAPGTGLGVGLNFNLESSTGESNAGRISVNWENATEASKESEMVFRIYRNSSSVDALGLDGSSGTNGTMYVLLDADFYQSLKVDTITEHTASAGVTVNTELIVGTTTSENYINILSEYSAQLRLYSSAVVYTFNFDDDASTYKETYGSTITRIIDTGSATHVLNDTSGTARVTITTTGANITGVSTISSDLTVGVAYSGIYSGSAPQIILASSTVGEAAYISLAGRRTGDGQGVGGIMFHNYDSGYTDKRIAQILGMTDVYASDSGYLSFWVWDTTPAAKEGYQIFHDEHVWKVSGTTEMTLTSTGLTLNGELYLPSISGGGGDDYLMADTGDSNRVYLESSDKRLKENIIDFDVDALGFFRELNVKKFDWINNRKSDIGWIAQDVNELLPEMAGTRPDGNMFIRTKRMIPLLHHAFKQHYEITETHEQKIARLEARVEELEKQLNN